jgi:hypothetical protein
MANLQSTLADIFPDLSEPSMLNTVNPMSQVLAQSLIDVLIYHNCVCLETRKRLANIGT